MWGQGLLGGLGVCAGDGVCVFGGAGWCVCVCLMQGVGKRVFVRLYSGCVWVGVVCVCVWVAREGRCVSVCV